MRKEEFDELPVSVIEFLHYISAIKNKSKLTVLEYASDLRLFFRFLAIEKKQCPSDTEFDKVDISKLDLNFVKSITIQDAYSFLSFCNSSRHNEASSRSRKVSSIRAYFNYMSIKTKQLDINPMQELETPKTKKSLPKYLTLDESLKLLDCIDGANKERDYCIIILFLNCGLRLSELVSLNYNHIHSDNTMTVIGKGNKERTIYLNEICVNAINEYLKVRPNDNLNDKYALFISRNRNRISPKTVQHIVKTFLEKSGLGDKGLSTHKLRHTAATLMYQHGDVDIMLIKEILGHENLSTTQIYTHVLDSQLQSAVNSNPLNQKLKKPDKK